MFWGTYTWTGDIDVDTSLNRVAVRFIQEGPVVRIPVEELLRHALNGVIARPHAVLRAARRCALVGCVEHRSAVQLGEIHARPRDGLEKVACAHPARVILPVEPVGGQRGRRQRETTQECSPVGEELPRVGAHGRAGAWVGGVARVLHARVGDYRGSGVRILVSLSSGGEESSVWRGEAVGQESARIPSVVVVTVKVTASIIVVVAEIVCIRISIDWVPQYDFRIEIRVIRCWRHCRCVASEINNVCP